MKDCPKFQVKKRTLLAIAGCVWLIAGVNVARLGLIAYAQMTSITLFHIMLCVLVFCLFGLMFYKMSTKHAKRIKGYPQETKPFWHFFDWKAYLIMVVMMSGGIWLRSSGLAPNAFIAVFYTGLGCALSLAGLLFWLMFIRFRPLRQRSHDCKPSIKAL